MDKFTAEELKLIKMAMHIATEVLVEPPKVDPDWVSQKKLAARFEKIADKTTS